MVKNRNKKKSGDLLFAFAVPDADGSIELYMLKEEGNGNFAVLDANGVYVTDVCTAAEDPRRDYLEGSALMSLLCEGVPIADSHLALHRITRGIPDAILPGEQL
jgi:hypothetical protein